MNLILKNYKRIYLFIVVLLLPFFAVTKVNLNVMKALVSQEYPYSEASLEILKDVSDRMGYRLSVTKDIPQNVNQKALNDDYDVVLNQPSSETLKKFFLFSKPIFNVTYVLYGLTINENFSDISKMLGSYKIGFVKGMFYGESFQNYISQKENEKKIAPILGKNPFLQGLLNVTLNQTDFFVCDALVCENVKSKEKDQFPELAQVTKTRAVISSGITYSFSFPKKRPNAIDMQREFNKNLTNILTYSKKKDLYDKYKIDLTDTNQKEKME